MSTQTAPMRLAYSRKEAAAAVGVSVDLIDQAIARGGLRAKRSSVGRDGRPAGRYLITETALREWLDSLEDA